jgi:hypothetical protein
LDIPKDRFDRFGPTFVFLKYLWYLNICEKNRNEIKFICSEPPAAENLKIFLPPFIATNVPRKQCCGK